MAISSTIRFFRFQENADHADREKNRAQNQEVGKRKTMTP